MKEYFQYENIPCGIANIDFLKVRRGRNFKMRYASGRKKNGFIFVETGSMLYTFTDADGSLYRWTLSVGDVIFIPSGIVYSATYLEDATSIVIAQFDLVYGKLPASLSAPCRVPIFEKKSQISSLFDSPNAFFSKENRSYWCTYKMYEILWYAVDSLQTTSPKFLKLAPALEDIQKNFEEQKKIGFYADLCQMSEPGFRRLFCEYTGMSPIEYRNRLRLEEADKLIRTGEYLVEEAANAVGFTNISFFCRSYKKHFGHTPLGQ